jgi:hypothetical protein
MNLVKLKFDLNDTFKSLVLKGQSTYYYELSTLLKWPQEFYKTEATQPLIKINRSLLAIQRKIELVFY